MEPAQLKPPGSRTRSMVGDRLFTWGVALTYLLLAIAYTWPVARGLTTDIPSLLGDSLLNMWIVSWDAEHLQRLAAGDFSVVLRWFDANIFYPAPNTLAFSEHLIPQAFQVLPVYALTGNPILCYNLLFLSTYVFSGVATYLLVRELTGDRRAAFAAGLFFAFVPYRNLQASHLQVLSSQWMPATLFGFARYLNTGRRRALAGGAFALVLQCLSCGYYLVYFTPFAAGYVLWELARRGRLRDRRAWLDFTVAACAVGAALTPFLIPYARVQSATKMVRGIDEVVSYSADVYSYLTALPTQRVWGPFLQLEPAPEGALFMGAVPLILGLLAAGLVLAHAWRSGRSVDEPRPVLSTALGAGSIAVFTLMLIMLFVRRVTIEMGSLSLRATDVQRVLTWLAVTVVLWLICSPRTRARLRACARPETFFLLSVVVTWWLSLGPSPRALGRPLGLPAAYSLLYALPGGDGLRVPARFAMVMALMLAVTAGYALARLPRRRAGALVIAVVAVAFMIEAPLTEFPLNGLGPTEGHALPEARVYPPIAAPPLYRIVANLDARAVLLEMPLGDTNWDVRAVYYSTAHWRHLVNGYSGFFPEGYDKLANALADPDLDAGRASQALAESGATHVLVHGRAFRPAENEQIRRWLTSVGAQTVAIEEDDILYELPR